YGAIEPHQPCVFEQTCHRESDLAETGAFADPSALQRDHALGCGVEHGLRSRLYAGQQIGIPDEVRDLELHQPGLARAEQLPGPTKLEVAACDLEAVGGVAHDTQTLACEAAKRRPIEQDAGALDRTAPDPAAQLVKL